MAVVVVGPVWAPNPPDQNNWYPKPGALNAGTLQSLISPKMFGAPGQVPAKQWRWDHVPDAPWYPPSEWLNAGTLQQLTANKQPFNRQWRYDLEDRTYVETPTSFNWFGSAKILTFPSNNPFSKLWRWDRVEEPPWYPPSEWLNSSAIQQLTVGGKPFSKQWRWDYTPDPQWVMPAQYLNADAAQYLPSVGVPESVFYAPKPAEQLGWNWTPSFLQTISVKVAQPFFNQWQFNYVEQPWWQITAETLNSAAVQLLTAGGEPFNRQWRYDLEDKGGYVEALNWFWQSSSPSRLQSSSEPFFNQWYKINYVPEPGWLGEAVSSTSILTQQTQLYQPGTIWAPDGEQNMPLWTATKQQSIGLTQTNPFFKLWRYDHVPEPTWYPPSEWLNSGAVQLTYQQQKLFGQAGQVLTKLWRWDHVPEPPWSPFADSLNSSAIQQLTAGGKPFSKQDWRYDLVEQPGWVWAAPQTPTSNSLATTKPFYQLWNYNHVPEPPWSPASGWLNSSQLRALVGGTPFTKQWRWDQVPEPSWYLPVLNAGSLYLSATQQAIFGQPGQGVTKPWRYDYVEQPPWWLPLQYLTAAPAQYQIPTPGGSGSSFYVPRPPEHNNWNWFPPPLQAFALSQLELYSPSTGWQANVAEQVSWAWNPPSTELIKQLVVSQPFNRQWRYDVAEWIGWSPAAEGLNSAAIQILTGGGKPFSKQWRYDTLEQPIWSWLLPNASLIITTTAIPEPFNKQWIYDVTQVIGWYPPSVWRNSSPIQVLTGGGNPFSKLWRYDLVEQPGWLWLMQNASVQRFLTQSKVTSPQKFWRWDHVPEPPWYPPLDWLTSAVIKAGVQPVTFYGKPGQAPTKFWGGLYNYVPEPPWQYPTTWMNSQQFTLPLPPPPPPPPPPELGQVLTSPREIRALWVQPGVRTIVMPYLVRKILVREN
jgi:hypothetical protein